MSEESQEEQEKQLSERRLLKINDMRAVLDFLESNSDVPAPYFGTLNAFDHGGDPSEIARMLSPCEKIHEGPYFMLRKKFGSVKFDVNFSRESVCERVVIGTEEIPEKIIPASIREIVEWVCSDSILKPDDDVPDESEWQTDETGELVVAEEDSDVDTAG